MLGLLTSAQILLFTGATDMRKGFDGLIALVMAAGGSEHAQNLAVLHSIVATCRMHKVNAYEYIKDMLIRTQTHPASRIDELMPWRWRPPSS